MQTNSLTIGKLAERAGVGVETIRYYERRGLIEEPPRSASGYRSYPLSAVDRLLFIRRARAVAFSLDEIIELLGFQTDSADHCADVAHQLESKIAEIDEQMHDLQRMKAVLERLVATCGELHRQSTCPALEAWSEIQAGGEAGGCCGSPNRRP